MVASPIRCLITAGPTREFFDPVRFISNPSSGKMGFALAEAAGQTGWAVDLVAGPVTLVTPEGVNRHDVVTGDEMYEACDKLFPQCDVLIKTAAVCDFRPARYQPNKVKKGEAEMTVTFEPVVDILKSLSSQKRKQVLVGFAAETRDVEAYARRKLEEKNLDWIVANQVGQPEGGFESDHNSVTMINRDGERICYGPSSKKDIARSIIARLSLTLSSI